MCKLKSLDRTSNKKEGSEMEIEKTNRINGLFEFYESLLTEKQQNYMQLYYADDFSLGEIAEEFGVSRQAVYDNIKRTEHILLEYEKKLHIVADFKRTEQIVEELASYVEANYSTDKKLTALIQQLQDEKDEK